MRLVRSLKEKPIPTSLNHYQSAVLEAPKQIQLEELELPKPGKDEVRIKLEGCGLCASNIPVWEGREWFEYPLKAGAPGHEPWGIIDAVGVHVKDFEIGDRVTALTFHAYAEYDISKAEHTIKLPATLEGKPFPGEPLGCAMNVFSRSQIANGQTVAIVGCGFLGCLLVQLAKSAGAQVIAISQREFSLEAAKNAGADSCIKLEDHYEIIEEVKQLTDGKFCERVIEATGKEWPLNLAIELTATRGKLIVAGFHQDGMRSVNMQLLNWRGIDMISAHERDPKAYINGIKQAITAIEEGKMKPFSFFTHTFSLQEMENAFCHLCTRPEGFIKALIINK